MDRPQRLLALLVALQASRQLTAEELAGQLGVSRRTILRDVDALAAADVPVVAERGRYGGITLAPGMTVDVGRLTGTETEVLALVGVDAARARQLGVDVAARSAAHKLAARRGRRGDTSGGERPLALTEVVVIDNAPWFARQEPAGLAALVGDVRRGRRLRIAYRSSGGRIARESDVDPYGVAARGGSWYLVADVGGQPRMFALARLSSWTVLEEDRRVRPGVALAEVVRDLATALEDRHEVIVTAVLDADREDIARRILGSRLRSAEATDDPDRVRITVGYDQLGGVRQLLQFSDHIEVTDPPEARRLVANLAEVIAQRHRDHGDG